MIVRILNELGLENQWFVLNLGNIKFDLINLQALKSKETTKVETPKLSPIFKGHFEGFLFSKEPTESWQIIDFPNQAHL